MSRTFQIRTNGLCLIWALALFQWRKLPHFNRGLCRAFLGDDRLGRLVAHLWPVGTLVGVLAVLLLSK
jgi:hypothetical protein